METVAFVECRGCDEGSVLASSHQCIIGREGFSAAPKQEAPVYMKREDAIARIKAGLKARSGKTWSVTGGRGTAWGWLRIDAPPARRGFDGAGLVKVAPAYKGDVGASSLAEREELGRLLNLGHPVHHQGESVPSGSHYWEEYVARAEGRTPERYGAPYWD